MQTTVDVAMKVSWSVLGVYWLVGSRGGKAADRREAAAARLLKYWLPLIAAVALVGPGRWYGNSWLHERFRPRAAAVDWLGAAMLFAGALLAGWSRRMLGRNWSLAVTLKRDHELIQRGPYRAVRHPIYTGLILAFAGTALAIGEWRALLAVVILGVSFWFKLRMEERWLGEQFGEVYARYRARTKALVPGVW
jgi:protein-S-isoprenylcysteine O-methyltransferase Ste14